MQLIQIFDWRFNLLKFLYFTGSTSPTCYLLTLYFGRQIHVLTCSVRLKLQNKTKTFVSSRLSWKHTIVNTRKVSSTRSLFLIKSALGLTVIFRAFFFTQLIVNTTLEFSFMCSCLQIRFLEVL